MPAPDAYWYTVTNEQQVSTPALVIYPERVSYNINLLKSMIDDVSRLRPHVKTHKSSEATLMLLQAGITRFKCATIAEAEMLAISQAPDVLLAYQPVGPNVQRFIELNKTYLQTCFACLVDNRQSADTLARQARDQGICLNVYVDLNVGMNRTGIAPEFAVELYEYSATLQGIQPIGLHAYDGHIHNIDLNLRRKRAEKVFELVTVIQQILAGRQPVAPQIVIGGTPTFPVYAAKQEVECSPGTFIYWDAGYRQACPEQHFEVAALLLTRVVARPAKNLICVDLGHKAVSAENALERRVFFPDAPQLNVVSQSEEHLVIDAGQEHNYQIGDVLYVIPYHICPTVALYDDALTANNGNITGTWNAIARKRKINI